MVVGLGQFVAAPVRSLTKEFGTRLAEVKASAFAFSACCRHRGATWGTTQ
jgi:hypothetical protein